MNKRTILFSFVSFLLLAGIILFFNHNKQNKKIVEATDFAPFIQEGLSQNNPSNTLNSRIDFWNNKLEAEPQSGLFKIQVAGLLAERFKTTGKIKDIQTSDSLLHSALSGPLLKKAAAYHALSANALTRHNFQKALQYADMALETGEAPEVTHLYRFDALLELGQLNEAEKALSVGPRNRFTFDRLIRQAKLQDARGDLPAAIKSMEAAEAWSEKTGREALHCWTLSNLGDMYGHAGLVERSYNTYLKVLNIDPSYHYALKGIAWIAYSHDQDIEAARQITLFLKDQTSLPDQSLFLSELAAFEGNDEEEKRYLEAFMGEAGKPQYGRMYHSYLADIRLSRSIGDADTRKLVAMEIENRPTAPSYLLLARYYHTQGADQLAATILEEHVEGHSFEPDVLMEMGILFKAAGNKQAAKTYLKEAAGARLELGPIAAAEIEQALASL